jgi:hypothetical protein
MSTKKENTATATAAKKPRIVSPEKAALREKYKLESQALDTAKKSAATLKRITEDLLPKLTADDKTVLLNAIKPAN